MKKNKVWRYYCEYCKKSNYSGGTMKTHEKHCTMNPERKCRMCEISSGASNDVKKLLEMLPEPVYQKENFVGDYLLNVQEVKDAIKKVTSESEGCPACTLAALRQKGISIPDSGFNFKKECESFWADMNEQDAMEDQRGY